MRARRSRRQGAQQFASHVRAVRLVYARVPAPSYILTGQKANACRRVLAEHTISYKQQKTTTTTTFRKMCTAIVHGQQRSMHAIASIALQKCKLK